MYRLNKKMNHGKVYDFITAVGIFVGIMALLALLVYQLIPVKLADIKVPVATDKASYYAGQDIGGLFFGEIYYNGEVRVLREVFCKDYRGVIKPPSQSAVGDTFSTQSRPHKLEGQSVPIGTLPTDIPLGSNCVLQFTNIYEIKTPFGTRHEEYQYYTQNFSIITKERRLELDSGTTQTPQNNSTTTGGGDASSFVGGDSSDGKTETNNSTTNNTTNNTTTTTPPVQLHEECRFNFIFKVGCRQVAD